MEFAGRVFKRIVCGEESSSGPMDIAIPNASLVGFRLLDGSPSFGKVMRNDGEDVLLMLLKQNQAQKGKDQLNNAYVAELGTLVRKPASELIFPIDGVYNGGNGCYEIITELEDIDRLLN